MIYVLRQLQPDEQKLIYVGIQSKKTLERILDLTQIESISSKNQILGRVTAITESWGALQSTLHKLFDSVGARIEILPQTPDQEGAKEWLAKVNELPPQAVMIESPRLAQIAGKVKGLETEREAQQWKYWTEFRSIMGFQDDEGVLKFEKTLELWGSSHWSDGRLNAFRIAIEQIRDKRERLRLEGEFAGFLIDLESITTQINETNKGLKSTASKIAELDRLEGVQQGSVVRGVVGNLRGTTSAIMRTEPERFILRNVRK